MGGEVVGVLRERVDEALAPCGSSQQFSEVSFQVGKLGVLCGMMTWRCLRGLIGCYTYTRRPLRVSALHLRRHALVCEDMDWNQPWLLACMSTSSLGTLRIVDSPGRAQASKPRVARGAKDGAGGTRATEQRPACSGGGPEWAEPPQPPCLRALPASRSCLAALQSLSKANIIGSEQGCLTDRA
jgi:hypothetical protein